MATTISTTRHEVVPTRERLRGWGIQRFGDPQRDHALITLETLPLPKVEPEDVVIRMYGAEIGDWDALVASGEWSVERSFPIILGLAGAGSIVAVGKSVVGLTLGDLVYTFSHPLAHTGCPSREHNGAWAEYMLVPADRVALAPKRLDLAHAGAVPIVGLTAHETIVDILKVERHDVVLVTAAAGGVGHLAVQLAARRGARVIATARQHNHDFLRSLGAEIVIDYTREDVVRAVRSQFPLGVDKALNGVDGEAANDVVKAVRDRGHVVDLSRSATARVPDGRVETDYVVRPDRLRLAALADLFERGELKLEVAHKVPFARAREGLGEVLGKQVRGVVALEMP
jgi:NADPH2:quinone reductase